MLFEIRFDGKPICAIFGKTKVDALAAFISDKNVVTDEELSKLDAVEVNW